jgi:hypothetical protein
VNTTITQALRGHDTATWAAPPPPSCRCRCSTSSTAGCTRTGRGRTCRSS